MRTFAIILLLTIAFGVIVHFIASLDPLTQSSSDYLMSAGIHFASVIACMVLIVVAQGRWPRSPRF